MTCCRPKPPSPPLREAGPRAPRRNLSPTRAREPRRPGARDTKGCERAAFHEGDRARTRRHKMERREESEPERQGWDGGGGGRARAPPAGLRPPPQSGGRRGRGRGGPVLPAPHTRPSSAGSARHRIQQWGVRPP